MPARKTTFEADGPETLAVTPADAAIAGWALAFVTRRNGRGGNVMYELPELRSSIQIMLGDDYWLRERSDAGSWARVPRIALWGPRVTWGYGYARKVVHAFGFALTPAGVAALTGHQPGHFVDRVVDFASLNPAAASGLAGIVSKGTPDDWTRESSALLSTFAGGRCEGLDPAIPMLVESEADAVHRASVASGVGDRHFRRLFRSKYGLSPRLYRRVLRIDRLLRRLHPRPWETDAYELDPNFADQAHMIREFKALTGLTPREYVRSKQHGDATIRSAVATGIKPPRLP